MQWDKPWINSRGHSLTSNMSISKPEQSIGANYKIPLKVNPLEQYYGIQGGYKRTDLNDTRSDTTTLNVSRNWDMSTGWQYSINTRWSLSHFTQGDVTNTTMLLYPGANASRVRQRGGMMPYWGIANVIQSIIPIKYGDLMLNFSPYKLSKCGYAHLGKATVLWSEGRLAGLKRINLRKYHPNYVSLLVAIEVLGVINTKVFHRKIAKVN